MNTSENKKATSIRLSRRLYERIEKIAKREHRSVNNLIELALENVFNVPNEATLQAIEEIEKGKTQSYKSVDELFNSI